MLAQLPRAAQAQSDDQLARARTHFEAGRALYQLGNYTDALREFAAGYQLAPQAAVPAQPRASAIASSTTSAKAREMYQRYLHDAPPRDPERPQAQQILAEIEQQLADRQAASAPPPRDAVRRCTVAATEPCRR